MTMSTRMRVAFATHRGRVREKHEDCIGVMDWVTSRESLVATVVDFELSEPCMCIVADGLGGHGSGEVASRLAVQHLLNSTLSLRTAGDLTQAIEETNRHMYDVMHSSVEMIGMGATIVGLLVIEYSLHIFNLGDCRAYEIVPGPYLRMLSIDDVPKRADYNPETRTGMYGHTVTQCIGGGREYARVEPHIVNRSVSPGVKFLLCSDGITDMLGTEEIEGLLSEKISASVSGIMQAAMAAGGVDNASIMIVEFVQ